MRVLAEYGNEEIAKVYVVQLREDEAGNGKSRKYVVECVESVQPPIPREKKWVLIVSTMFGCPIKCKFCDAGGDYLGKLTAEEILAQIAYIVRRRFPDNYVPIPKFKIQFARMGEPSLNPAVLEAMRRLPEILDAPGLNVSLSTIAPKTNTAEKFFEELIEIKEQYYSRGRFQLQFSIHTTDVDKRNELIPIKKWSFEEIAAYGDRFSSPESGDKKVTLNFAPAVGYPLDAKVIRKHFDPSKFIIKITPLNPTVRSHEQSLQSLIDPYDSKSSQRVVEMFEKEGFEVILSIGELEENKIGSNCGQYVQRAIHSRAKPESSYDLEKYGVRIFPS
ncbi:MAG: radical SAM protein [Methanomassiliicoccales archaeon]|jgi:23S rRNA (adenine2503-C2)-methyltransferase|nr:radical SAM protein [Methanomassiliicoccales archaeon]